MRDRALGTEKEVPSNSVDSVFHRFTAVVGEADRELTCVTLTYHSSGPFYETSAQSTKSHGTKPGFKKLPISNTTHL